MAQQADRDQFNIINPEEITCEGEFIADVNTLKQFDQAIDQAESDIQKNNLAVTEKNIHFRWNIRDYTRANKIAEKLGLKYQAYLKMRLKEILDRDEKILFE